MTATRSRAHAWPASAGTDAAALVASAARLRWRAPELTLLLADRASTAAAGTGEESVRLRAEVLAVFACNQLGRGASAGGRAVRALRAAQAAGAPVTERLVRVELAACASDASAPAVALALLQPVLTTRRRVAPTARAAAMVAAADGLARLGGGPEVAALLTAADRLYDASRAVEPDAVLLRRGVVQGRLAAHHRRIGDHVSAEQTARRGLALLDELSDKELETGQVSGALTLELVFALLDSGQEAEAVLAAQSVLRRPVRPAGAPAACWLRLALASRVHLPAGRYSLARRLLGDAAFTAERHQLDPVLAECRQLQTQLHERCAEFGEALCCLRAALVAERRWRDCVGQLRTLLAGEFGPSPSAAELRAELAAVVATADQPRPDRANAERPAATRPVRLGPPDIGHGGLGRSSAATELATPTSRRAAGRHSMLDQERPPDNVAEAAGSYQRPPAAESIDHPQPAPRARPAEAVQEPAAAGSFEGAQPAPLVGSVDRSVRPTVAGLAEDAQPTLADASADAAQRRGVASSFEGAQSAAVVEPAEGPQRPGAVGFAKGGHPVPVAASVEAAKGSAAAGPVEGAQQSQAGSFEGAQPASFAGSAQDAHRTGAAGSFDRAEPVSLGGSADDAQPAPVGQADGPAGGAEHVPTPRMPAARRPDMVDDVAPANRAELELVEQETDRGTGRHRSDVALADLLAEALMAYQNGRRSRLAAEAVPIKALAPGQGSAEQQPEPDPSVTQPTAVPTTPIDTMSAGQPYTEIPRPRFIDLPREQVWREPGTF